MAERSAEVVVCGASIMTDVWEIRLNDFRRKMRLENERLRRSALEKINQDWQARMSDKIKTPKRLERKAKPSEESTLQAQKVVQQKNQIRPQGFQSSRLQFLQKQADLMKTTKANKPALLRHLNERCPDLMVWAKSWKFSQPLPQSEEGKKTCCVSDWGTSWKFLNLQPNTEGKAWFDLGFDTNYNMTSDGILFLWETIGKALDSQHLRQDVSAPEWQKSWVFTQKRKESHEGTANGPRNNDRCLNWNKFSNLLASHHQNQENSEWHKSWKSTKPVKDGEAWSDLNHPISNEEDQLNEEERPALPWSTSWMYFKKQLHMKSKTSTSYDAGWSQSWRVSKSVAEQKKSICSQEVQPEETKLFNIFNVIVNLSREMKHTILRNAHFHRGDIHSPEWEKSWVTLKNLSDYKEETNKAECTEKSTKTLMEEPTQVAVKIETPQTQCQHVKFDVLASPNGQKWHKILNFFEQNKRETHALNWKDSWKMLKHQCKEERALRNQRCPLLQLHTTLQTSLAEWGDSRRLTNLTINQDSNLWQQGWPTNTQPGPKRRMREPVLNEDVPYNGPTGVRGWGESWRSTRHQYRLERQGASTQLITPQAYGRSVVDWEQSWQSSTNQHRHDRPSMTEWINSWRFSSDNLGDIQPENKWFEKSMEIKARQELYRASYKHSRSFDSHTFGERFSSKLWNDSCRVKKQSDGTGSHYLIKKEVLDWDNSWMFTSTDLHQIQGDYYLNFRLSSDAQAKSHEMPKAVQIESKSEWGRSWKISNPQPPENIALWGDAKPKSFCAQDLILWKRHKHHNHFLSALRKEPGRLKIWGKSWRFIKLESKQDFNSLADESVIMNNTTKIRKHRYSNIDKHKPQEKRWKDACKMPKMRPPPKREIRHRSAKEQCEDGRGTFAEWMESWRFSAALKTHEPAEVSGSLGDWKNSWKILLDPQGPLNGPQTIKGR